MVTRLLGASGLILAGVAGPLAPDLAAQAAGKTGYGQGEGVEATAASSSPSAFPGTPPGSMEAANAVTFRIRVENISRDNVLRSSGGEEAPFALAPGLWVVHEKDDPVFLPGKPQAGRGLEPLAEDGAPGRMATALQGQEGILAEGVYNTPVGETSPGPAGPGAAYEFTIEATPGSRLTIAEMFGQSNDLFYAPDEDGIALFDGRGKPVSGDVTKEIGLWDAGTEANQEPGFGPDQAPRQKAPNTGAGEKRPVGPVKDRFKYPAVKDVLRVTVTPQS